MTSVAPLDFLFATWEGGGNVPPVLTLVGRLVGRGHRVRVLGDECTRPQMEAAGAAFSAWKHAPSRPDLSIDSDPMRDWEAAAPTEVIRRIVGQLMCGNARLYAQDILDELHRGPADVIVTSEMLFGAIIAGEAASVPVVALGCNIPIVPISGIPPFGPGFAPAQTQDEHLMHEQVRLGLEELMAEGLAPLNDARKDAGLEPVDTVWEQLHRADRYLVATSRSFDFPSEALPPNLRYIGPLMDEPTWAGAQPVLSGTQPLVLVSFSTTYQAQEAALQRVISALGRLPVRGLVTTGPLLDPDSFSAPDNVQVVRTAPHDVVMRQAAAVVTHAGHGTVMRALLAQKPMLCLPMGRDQNDNAARVVQREAGLVLPPDAPEEDIARAISSLLDDPRFATAAAELGRRIARETSPDRAADELEAAARQGKAECSLRSTQRASRDAFA